MLAFFLLFTAVLGYPICNTSRGVITENTCCSPRRLTHGPEARARMRARG